MTQHPRLDSTRRDAGSRAAGQLAFGEPEADAGRAGDVCIAYVDGASRGNPGPASYAVILRGPDGKIRFETGKYLGRATNNVAEYYALITALDYATTQRITRLRVRSDSELLVRQMQGRYKVKSPGLRPLHERAQKMARGLQYFAIEHVPREQNSAADELANRALDQTATRGAASGQPPAESPSSASPSGSAPAPSSGKAPRATTAAGGTIRARYSAGALHPLAALDLAEGQIVEVRVTKLHET